MRHKIKAIVLNYIRYSESSVITRMYTDLFGLQSYIVNSVRSSRPKHNIALFQPLTQLELVAYHNEKGNLNRVSEVRILDPYSDIPFNIRKSTVAIFLSEVLTRTLKEESAQENLFDFISNSILQYDRLKENYRNFHIQFLFRYLKYIGLEPSLIENLFEGADNALLYHYLDHTMVRHFINDPYGSVIGITHSQRREIVDLLADFICRNMGIDEKIKSLKILKEVFD